MEFLLAHRCWRLNRINTPRKRLRHVTYLKLDTMAPMSVADRLHAYSWLAYAWANWTALSALAFLATLTLARNLANLAVSTA